MATIFGNFNSGAVDTANLLIAGTTVNSAAFSTLPTVAAPDTLWLTLDPTGIAGNPEIVQVTTHTAAATVCTIVRAQQGTTARQHNIGALWAFAATKSDLDELPFRKLTTTGDILYGSAANTATRLGVGATGTRLTVAGGVPTWAADTANTVADAKGDLLAGTADNVIAKLTAGANGTRLIADSAQATGLRWAADTEVQLIAAKGDVLYGTANDTVAVLSVGATDGQGVIVNAASTPGVKYSPVGVILTDTAQAVANNTATDITWATEVSDPAGWTAGAIATLTVPAGAGGRYVVTFSGVWSASPSVAMLICIYNGTGAYGVQAAIQDTPWPAALTFVRTMVAGDTLKFQAYQGSGGSLNFTGRLEIGSALA